MATISRNEQRINNLCISKGFDPCDVCALTKLLLEHYRSGFEIPQLFKIDLDSDGIRDQKISMRRDFLEAMRLPLKESTEYLDRIFQNLRDCTWMRSVIDMVLDAIADGICEGDLYKRIIENYYLNSESISNEEMARAENLSTASIERKKREAIKYLGISMYIYACCREQEERDQYDRAR